MKIKHLATALAVTIGLLFTVSTAHAKKPLDVDCGVLADTNDAVNVILDDAEIQFDNLGDLVSAALVDGTTFDLLHDLILVESGGTIDFESASQAISTNSACGLIGQLIGNIAD